MSDHILRYRMNSGGRIIIMGAQCTITDLTNLCKGILTADELQCIRNVVDDLVKLFIQGGTLSAEGISLGEIMPAGCSNGGRATITVSNSKHMPTVYIFPPNSQSALHVGPTGAVSISLNMINHTLTGDHSPFIKHLLAHFTRAFQDRSTLGAESLMNVLFTEVSLQLQGQES